MTSLGSHRPGTPGILDVAERAGVSGATVSRVFTGADPVRPQTRERVLVAARELGFIRNRPAAGLHGRRSGSVGLIVPTIDNAIFSEMIQAFSTRLHEHEVTMLIATHDYDVDREVALVRSLLERRIDALALIGRDHDPVVLQMLAVRNVPLVSLWNSGGDAGVPFVGADNRAAGRLAAEHLIRLGHRDIALLFPDTRGNDRAADRLAGAHDALRAAGIVVPHHRQRLCPYDMLAAKTLTEELLGHTDRPGAIIGGNDVIAVGALHGARRAGIDVPRALSVIGIGDFKGSAAVEPGLSTVRLPARRIGTLGADALIARLNATAPEPVAGTVLDCTFVARASTGPVSDSSSGAARTAKQAQA